jgi:hypothetical protein
MLAIRGTSQKIAVHIEQNGKTDKVQGGYYITNG